MKRLFFCCALVFFAFYLYTMNSTENRQSLADPAENAAYMNFVRQYVNKYGRFDNQWIPKCFNAYNSLINMRPSSFVKDENVKRRLVDMNLCELDEGVLVLKGFHVEDNLSALVYSREKLGKK